MVTLISALGLLRPVRDHLPTFGIDHEQVLLTWSFATILVGVVSVVTSLIATICFIILLTKRDIPSQTRRSGLLATSLAWTSLAISVGIVS